MKKNIVNYKFKPSSFLSCEKDTEIILRRLFVENQPYSDILKRLLVVNTKDCLDNVDSVVYKTAVEKATLAKLIENKYIKIAPKIRFPENEEVKSYIILTYDNFSPNAENPEFRDCTVNFDIICHTDYWDISNYRVRPLKIAGYIDSLLDKSKLTGIGTLNFIGCNELILDENLSGYTLSYRAVHGNDDKIPPQES